MPHHPKGVFRRGRSWYVRLREGGSDRWMCLGPDYQEALRRLRRLPRGGRPLGARSTVAEAAVQWVATYVRTARDAKGVGIVESRVRRYLTPALGAKPVERVTADDLRRYRLWLEKQAISAQTVAHVLSDARCLFNWCEDAGLVDRSPVPRRLLPRIQERPPDRLTDAEVDAVVRLPDPDGFVVRFALATGLRWGELCRAQAAHVESDMLVVSRTKSRKVRRVPLSPEIRAELAERAGKLVPFTPTRLTTFTRRVRRTSGVTRFHAHQLRHTFACQWLERGGSLAALQQILGHSSIVTTQRYARLTDELVRREAERIGGSATRTVADSVAGGSRDHRAQTSPGP